MSAIIGRKLCGCAVAVDLDDTPETRREMSLKGYRVEVIDDTVTPINSVLTKCPHAPAVIQLFAEIDRLSTELRNQQSDPAWVVKHRDELISEVASLKTQLQQAKAAK